MVKIGSCRGPTTFCPWCQRAINWAIADQLFMWLTQICFEQAPAETDDDDGVSASAARHDGSGRYDACSGVVCPPLDCPTRPYIPAGQCCPICPSAPAQTVRPQPKPRTTRPEIPPVTIEYCGFIELDLNLIICNLIMAGLSKPPF